MNFRKRLLAVPVWVVACSLAAFVLASSPGGGVDDDAIFELEGNATDETPTPPGDDWATVNSSGGSSLARTGLVTDGVGATDRIFTGGGSKDIHDVSQWDSRVGAPPDKDDITHAYAAAYTLPNGHIAIYFGSDRFDNSGDAQMGFWFFQNDIGFNSTTGEFTGTPDASGNLHRLHDLLIVAHFTIGGAVPEIEVFEWVGGKDGIALVVPSNTAGCDPSTGSSDKCAIVNGVTVPSPWAFLDKSGSTSFLQGEFLEGGLDLTALFNSLGIPIPCISTFMAETRSSAEANAVLKDFVPPAAFPLCGIEITKQCTGANVLADGKTVHYTFSGNITNTGVGSLFDIVVTDTFPAGATNTTLNQPLTTTLAAGATTTYSGSFDLQAIGQIPNSVSVEAAANPGGAKTITDTGSWVPCQPALAPGLVVTKECETAIVAQGGLLVIRVDISGTVSNTGNTEISNITVADNHAGTILSGLTLAPGAFQNFAASYFPSVCTPGPAGGRCEFTDEVSASGISALSGQPVNALPAMATCHLCPAGACVSP